MREVLGNPYLHDHQNYSDIPFKVPMKTNEGPGKPVLWEAPAADSQDGRQH